MKLRDDLLHGISGAIRVVPMWSCVAFIAKCAKDVFIAFSGKETNAQLIFQLLTNITISQTLTTTGFIVLVIWGMGERVVRKRVIKNLSPYQQKYEALTNQNRRSSNLNLDGTTRMEDKV